MIIGQQQKKARKHEVDDAALVNNNIAQHIDVSIDHDVSWLSQRRIHTCCRSFALYYNCKRNSCHAVY